MDDRPTDPIDAELVDRYLAGAATPDEIASVEAWLRADPSHAVFVEALRVESARGRVRDPVRAWEALEESLRGLAEAEVISQRKGPRLPRPLRELVMTGAVIGAAIVMVIVLRLPHRGQPAWQEYATRAGQRESVTLADGTEFTLAPASRLRVPVDYTAGDRAVSLDGEAFFVVVHNGAHPFSVHAHNAIATDIGTRFGVRAYRDDRGVRVAVAEGRVGIASAGLGTSATSLRHAPSALRLHDNNTTLDAGDVAVIDTALAITHGVDVAAITGWTNGRLAFDSATAGEVVAELRRWYDVDLALGDASLNARHVTATFTSGESVDQAVEVLRALLGARVERDGRRITLYGAAR